MAATEKTPMIPIPHAEKRAVVTTRMDRIIEHQSRVKTYRNGTKAGNCKGNPETALPDHLCKASIKYVGFLEFFSSSSTTVFEGTTVAKSMR